MKSGNNASNKLILKAPHQLISLSHSLTHMRDVCNQPVLSQASRKEPALIPDSRVLFIFQVLHLYRPFPLSLFTKFFLSLCHHQHQTTTTFSIGSLFYKQRFFFRQFFLAAYDR